MQSRAPQPSAPGEWSEPDAAQVLREREALWARFGRFVQQIHASLNLRATAYTIANEGRGLVECDRLSVATARGGKARLLATSGVDRFDRRSQSARLMERLATAVLVTGEALWLEDNAQPLPPQIDEPLQALLDETHARAIAVIPLRRHVDPASAAGDPESDDSTAAGHWPSDLHGGGEPAGALIVERFDMGAFDAPRRQRIAAVAEQSALALGNAQTFESVPFSSVLRALGALGWFARARRLPKTIAAVVAIAAAMLAMALIPADFTVTARGRLQPANRHEVFAPADGVVADLHVKHNDAVAKGDLLGRIDSRQFEQESTRLAGEIQTTTQRLNSVQSSRSAGDRDHPNTPEKLNELAAEEEELTLKLANLADQKKILDREGADLDLRSPLSGNVITWDAQQSLADRPVVRGQSLLTVADLHGDWVIEAPVADDHIGDVLSAQDRARDKSADAQLPVSFILATEPGKTHKGKVERVALAADTDKTAGTTVMVTISFSAKDIPADELRPGATVVAKISCGRRSIGYVWFHELWRTIQAHVLF